MTSRSITLAIILFFRNIIECTLIMASSQNVSPASNVMSTQDFYPTDSSALQYFILEELPAGTLVGNVPRDFQLNERYTPPAADGSFQFRFLSRAGLADRKLFDIDPLTGIIRTLERIDREDVCSQRPEVINIGKSSIATDVTSDDLAVSDDIRDIECFFVVDVAVQPMRFFRIIRVRIEIIDVNDNSPTFPFPIVEHRISETAELGTSLLIDPAVDRDAGVNGECEYRLDTATEGVCASDDGNSSTGSGNKFQLTVDMQSNGDVRLKLVLVEPLDRETCDYFKFAIVAVDGGHTVRRTGSMVIDVRITDANDNAPEFRPKSHFRVMVVENSSAGYPVLRLSAIDRDVGQNAELHYSFVEQSATEFGHVFGIEPETGLIYTHRPLDRETPPETYRLYVVVHDSGGPEAEGALSAHALVEVHVTDVNDNAPTICMRPPAWNTASSVPNRHSKKTSDDVVRRLGATASRSGNSSAEECRTDYDQQGFLTYTVGSEIGNNGDVIIFVAHVTVHDVDAGNNSRFDCMLVGRDAGSFELRRIYVTEYVIVVDDGEEEYPDGVRDFSIVCRDYGRPETKTSSVDVRVVLPSNRLQFNSGLFHAAIDENNAVGTALIQLNVAEITDATIRSRVHYRLVASNQNDDDVLDLVDIDPVSGLVTAQKSFDRERGSTFDFIVIAEVPDRRRRGNQQDTAGNTATTRVIVTIRDVDDEHPRFDRKLYSFRVSENQLAGAKVGYLTAVDRDTFPFNRIVYSIDPTADQVFGVDPTSGLLFARHPLDRETQSVYHAVATAASPSTSTHPFGDDLTTLHVDTAEIDVIVDDVNDHRPEFKSLTVDDDHGVTENVVHVRSIDTVSIGDVVTTVTATDADAGRNAHLIYRIVGVRMIISGVERSLHFSPASASSPQQRSPEFFRIDPETGTITVAPDFRSATSNLVNGGATGEFLVEVSASDLGVPPLSSSITLRLVVEPSTDFSIVGQRRTYVNEDDDDVINDSGVNVSGSTLHDDDLLMMATFGLTAFAASACLIGIVFFASRKRRNRQCQRQQPRNNNGHHYHSVRLDELSSEAEPSAESTKRQQRKRSKRQRKQKEIDDEFGQEWRLPSSRDETRMNGRTKMAPGSSVFDKSPANSKVTARRFEDSSPSRSHVNKVTSSSAVVGNEYVVDGSTVRKTHVKTAGGNAKEDLKPLATVRPAISATSSMAAAERDGWRNCSSWSRHLGPLAEATVAPLPISGVCYDHFSKTIPVDVIELSECNEFENTSNDVIVLTSLGARGIDASSNPSRTLNGVLGDVKQTDAPRSASTAATAVLRPQAMSALSSNVIDFETTIVDSEYQQRDDNRQVQFAVSSMPVALRDGEPLLSYRTLHATSTAGRRHRGPSSASGVNVSPPLPTCALPTTHSVQRGADNCANQTAFGSRQRSASDDDIERRLRWTVQSRLPPSLRCDIEDVTAAEAEAEETSFQGSTLPPSYRHREINDQPAANKSNTTADGVASTSEDRKVISLPTRRPASALLGRQYVESMTSHPVRCTGRQLYSPATAVNADTFV